MIRPADPREEREQPPAPAAVTPARMVEAAPNRWVQLDLAWTPPAMVLCDVIPLEGHRGHFKLVPRTWEHLVRLDEDLTRRLGFGADTKPLRRLIKAGFVDGVRMAPRIYLLNLSSYDAHLRRCAEDPYFWENPKVLKEYKTAFSI